MSSALRIIVPENFQAERNYIVEVIFNEFLGIDYHLSFEDIDCYKLVLPNHKKIIFQDHFFSKNTEEIGYLSINNIPEKVSFIKNNYSKESDIPVIYGSDFLEESENVLQCGVDIFASSFFMLTRWEEYVNKERDKHQRFSAHSSLAYKHGFLQRPVVNEYVEMLWSMLQEMGFDQKRKERNFKWIITHDIDVLEKWSSINKIFRTFLGDLFLRRDVFQAFRSLISWIMTKLKLSKDPFDNYTFFMNVSEKIGAKSHFFFMSGGTSKYDNEYQISSAESIISMIKERGHHIGFHPSYNTYNNPQQFLKEKKKLTEISDTDIVVGRQHFLRCQLPETLQIWNDFGMKWDSTLGFAEEPGFRCGVCYEFSYFNFITREKLSIKERPLIIMDATLVDYKKYSVLETKNTISGYASIVKRYQGDFVFLWHNSSFELFPYQGYETSYKSILVGS